MDTNSTEIMDHQHRKSLPALAHPCETEKTALPGSDDTASSSNSTHSKDFRHDTWRGWIPVGAAACTLFVYLGVIYSWGIMQIKLVETTSSSLTTLMFVGSLATSFMISISILAGMAVRKIGYQATALAGACLMGLGEFLASWATAHIGALFVLHGLVFGVGGGLSIFVSGPMSSALCRAGTDLSRHAQLHTCGGSRNIVGWLWGSFLGEAVWALRS